MTVQSLQTTTNFVIQYDDSNAEAQGMAQAIANVCENEFTVLTGWFAITTGFGPSDRITVTVQAISKGGANNGGYQSGGNTTINVNFLPPSYSAAQADAIAPMMFINELVEVFMSFNNQKTGNTTWVAGHSDGEGLSEFCGILRFPVGHYLAYGSWANSWLGSGRTDYISSNESTDGNPVSFGCVLLFLFYLDTQLGFTPAQIIQAGASTPAGTYTNLTGDTSNPFGFFVYLINTVFPGTATITGASGQAEDDPFPIFTLQFWDNKNTFSKAEVTNNVALNKPFTDALLLVLEGCSPAQWQALGSPAPNTPAIAAPASFPGIGFNQTEIIFENPSFQKAPQRIHFHFNVTFDSTSPAGFSATPQNDELDSSILISGQTVPAKTELTFYGAEDPYFVTFNQAADNVPWLSEDLRVFSSASGGNPVPNGPAFNTDSIPGARTYLAALLPWLNQNFGDPGGTDPFDPASNVIPGQTNALQGDTSVIPNTGFLGIGGANVYNFAIARVRLGGALGTSSNPVKVFFRLWSTQTADTDYAPDTTYNSQKDNLGLPAWPLPDPDSSTYPFFATSNIPNFTDPNNTEFGAGGVNNQVITIDHPQGQWKYFGCLLNVYDSSYIVNGTPVTQLLNGTHHCLVAQIAYDDAPIETPPGVTVAPGNTDKLAQRNLQITAAYNPGLPPTNRVPQTFDVRPSTPASGSTPAPFDELMIDWGNVPSGSTGSIYWPGTRAAQVLALANQRYAYHALAASDANTITCPINGGLTYLPVPPSSGPNFAGLLTIELPQPVKKGQLFTVVVRRVTTTAEAPPPPPPQTQSPTVGANPAQPVPPAPPQPTQPAPEVWRNIAGAFQINIPVQADDEVLTFDEETLSIFKWRLSIMPTSNRWYPVLQRYIRYLSFRIDGHGGNAGAIQPSPIGLTAPAPVPGPVPGREHHTVCGKVCRILFDCSGDFEGFVVRCCEGDYAFQTCECGIEQVVFHALRHNVKLEVLVNRQTNRIAGLVLRR